MTRSVWLAAMVLTDTNTHERTNTFGQRGQAEIQRLAPVECKCECKCVYVAASQEVICMHHDTSSIRSHRAASFFLGQIRGHRRPQLSKLDGDDGGDTANQTQGGCRPIHLETATTTALNVLSNKQHIKSFTSLGRPAKEGNPIVTS